MHTEELVKNLRLMIPEALAIYRFGSWGTRDERPDSDIDLAVLASMPIDPVRRWETAQQLAGLVHRDVDLVDLKEASAVMRSQIVAHGERLYCTDDTVCAEFEDRVFVEYARLNEERQSILRDIAQRGKIYGR